jgi:hypothetical protein
VSRMQTLLPCFGLAMITASRDHLSTKGYKATNKEEPYMLLSS